MSTATAFGVALKAAMDAAGKGVPALARQTGIKPSTLYAYRAGSRNPPELAKIDAMCDALGLDEKSRGRLRGAAGITTTADLAELAADLVRALPTARDKRLAVELLRTQARLTQPTRKTGDRHAPMTDRQTEQQTDRADLDAMIDRERPQR